MNKRLWGALLGLVVWSGCSTVGPRALRQSRLRYNETIKATSEQEMLLNIVRLRYADTPSSLQVSNIAAQFELAASLGMTPFFESGTPAVLPGAGLGGSDRPTFTMTPLDDSDFARRLFTPLSLEGIVYLAKTTWPIQTVFRLYLENLNWVPNAETASGPTPAEAPPRSNFLAGMTALQRLQQRGDLVFGTEERGQRLGAVVPVVSSESAVAAAKEGLEFVAAPDGKGWQLERRERAFALHVNPAALDSDELKTLRRVFGLAEGVSRFDVTVESLVPFQGAKGAGLKQLDLETRSLLQALYFVAHGVQVPAEHLARGLARKTVTADGRDFDWEPVLRGLFKVRSTRGDCADDAHVAVTYEGSCFFIEPTDHDSKATFALLMELSRLEMPSESRRAPMLTIPLGGR